MAERVGFEPTVPSRVQTLSRRPPSTNSATSPGEAIDYTILRIGRKPGLLVKRWFKISQRMETSIVNGAIKIRSPVSRLEVVMQRVLTTVPFAL